jgi:Na+/melibiose symporter-like transporter
VKPKPYFDSRQALSLFQLFVYCSGGLAMNLTNLVLSEWLYERYVVGGVLGTAAFSLILLAGRITDALSDPFIAFWTDNSCTRWGHFAVGRRLFPCLDAS